MLELGVNIDHVATVRQARRTDEPDPVHAAVLAELGGAEQITLHLREDRRHIQDHDVRRMRDVTNLRMCLEMGMVDEIVDVALEVKPECVLLVPEKREEVTTEGGLDVDGQRQRVLSVIDRCQSAGIAVSLFIDADPRQVAASIELGADAIELHTGRYAHARGAAAIDQAIIELQSAINVVLDAAGEEFLISMPPPKPNVGPGRKIPQVNLGHGLTYRNLRPLLMALLPCTVLHELNIGHSIVSRSIMVGMTAAVREMKELISLASRDALLLWQTGQVPEPYAPYTPRRGPALGDNVV